MGHYRMSDKEVSLPSHGYFAAWVISLVSLCSTYVHHRVPLPLIKQCTIHKQLDEMYKTNLDHGKIIGNKWGDLE
jgi:hypothetical protein